MIMWTMYRDYANDIDQKVRQIYYYFMIWYAYLTRARGSHLSETQIFGRVPFSIDSHERGLLFDVTKREEPINLRNLLIFILFLSKDARVTGVTTATGCEFSFELYRPKGQVPTMGERLLFIVKRACVSPRIDVNKKYVT